MLLKFLIDGYYNGQHKYKKGVTYEIDNALGEADRWLKRGAIEVPFEEILPKEEQEKIVEVAPVIEEEITAHEELVVKQETKKENGRGNKRNKGIPLNETSEIL